MNIAQLRRAIDTTWNESIIDRLTEYVRIPSQSPQFDPQWEAHGYIEAALELAATWCRDQPVKNMRVTVRRIAGRTPLLVVDIPGDLPDCVLIVETSEESGSVDLPAHLDALGEELGDPSLIICLDAECGDYDRLWCTTSLRGCLTGRLHVRVLTEGVHSGTAAGIAATPFRIAAQLLARVEEPATSEMLLPELRAQIPPDRRAQTS